MAKQKAPTAKIKKPKKKNKPKYNKNSAIRSALRRSFSRSPIVREVLMDGRRELPKYNKDGSLAKKPKVEYLCQVCNQWHPSTKVAVDHIEPVIPLDDSWNSENPDWNMYVDRLWCDKTNLQRICESCHHTKTQLERVNRKNLKETLKARAAHEATIELIKIILE